MQDFKERLTITLSGKAHSAMIAFLKKHNLNSHDISGFIEEAVTWRIIERELEFHHGKNAEKHVWEDESPIDQGLLAGQEAVEYKAEHLHQTQDRAI